MMHDGTLYVKSLPLSLVTLLLSLLPSIYPQAMAALEGGGQACAVRYRPIELLAEAIQHRSDIS